MTCLKLVFIYLAGCAASDTGTICDQATAHLQSCGLTEMPSRSGATCEGAAATQAEAVLEMDCADLAASGKADGGGGNAKHSSGDDFKCTFLLQREHCACVTSARDYSNGSLSGRVLDADSGQPVTLEPGQWLEVKTADSSIGQDHQIYGARVDPEGNFQLKGLECDRNDLRVRVNDSKTAPRAEYPHSDSTGRLPLVSTLEGVPTLPEYSEWATVFSLKSTESQPPIKANVRPGVVRPDPR